MWNLQWENAYNYLCIICKVQFKGRESLKPFPEDTLLSEQGLLFEEQFKRRCCFGGQFGLGTIVPGMLALDLPLHAVELSLQVISRALGGKTGRSVHGWEVGLRKISILDALKAKPYALKVPASAIIVEIHQDQVSELPPNAELLALSAKTSAEMYAVGDHVFCIQGHPEFTEDIVINILDICQEKQIMPEDVISRAKVSFQGAKADYELFKQLCKSFLKQASRKSPDSSL